MGLLEQNETLRTILQSRIVIDEAGQQLTDTSGVRLEFAEALYRTVLEHRPHRVIEVGMAYGFSTLAILTALEQLGGEGHLISIDPYQTRDWRGVGSAHVRRSGLGHRHQLIEEPDYFALPELVRDGKRVDLAYIDGWHTFDYTLLDFWYLDKLLPPGGVVAFNDCGLRAVHRVIEFVRSHRRYQEMDVGLIPDYSSGNPLGSTLRRLTGRNGADRYFRKLEVWEPEWSFYARF